MPLTGPVAYFSMEVALEAGMPTYAGGLGVLAGDALRAAADLGAPLVGVTLLHRGGYFRQHLDAHGRQTDEPEAWRPEAHRALGALGDALEEMPERAAIEVGGRAVHLRAWRYLVRGVWGLRAPPVPVFLLDTAIEENHPDDRRITDVLYGGLARDRLRQEAVLGLGGVAMLRALGYRNVAAYHMNEGHSALLVLALLREQAGSVGRGVASEEARAAVRARCVFTTHTAVPAGHDHFALDLAREVLGEEAVDALAEAGGCVDGTLSMTHLALNASRYVNGVTARHGEVSRALFPGYAISSITNGVHAGTWTSPPFQALFDRRLPDWRRDNLTLRSAIEIPTVEVREAHEEAKRALLAEVERRTGRALAPDAMTLGFARRATAYKRTDLLFTDLDRLRALASTHGPLQVVVGGKAHPHDEPGQAMIRRVFDAAAALEGALPVVYLEDYGMALGQVVCAGVDLWLNTPQRPHEASGTSGMKAALNGVPSLSTLDGWWIEGHVEGVTGWSIGEPPENGDDGEASEVGDASTDAPALYDKLERAMSLYYAPDGGASYDRVRRAAIALNGSHFNAQRMLAQYVARAYEG